MGESLIFVGSIFVLVLAMFISALGAVVWARGMQQVAQARVHTLTAASTEKSLQETNDAVDTAKKRFGLNDAPQPSSDDLRRWAQMESDAVNGHVRDEYTTTGNEGYEETPPMGVGGAGDLFNTGPPHE